MINPRWDNDTGYEPEVSVNPYWDVSNDTISPEEVGPDADADVTRYEPEVSVNPGPWDVEVGPSDAALEPEVSVNPVFDVGHDGVDGEDDTTM